MEYELCLIDGAADIVELVQFDAYSDDIATEIAVRKAHGRRFELWAGNRPVLRYHPAACPRREADGERPRKPLAS